MATMPAVLVRLLTRPKHRRIARRAQSRVRAFRRYWKVTEKVMELLDVLVSPGTGRTSAVT